MAWKLIRVSKPDRESAGAASQAFSASNALILAIGMREVLTLRGLPKLEMVVQTLRGEKVCEMSAHDEGAFGVKMTDGYVVIDDPALRGWRIGSYCFNHFVVWAKRHYSERHLITIKLEVGDAQSRRNRDRRNKFYDQFGISFEFADQDGISKAVGESRPMKIGALIDRPVDSFSNIQELDVLDTLAVAALLFPQAQGRVTELRKCVSEAVRQTTPSRRFIGLLRYLNWRNYAVAACLGAMAIIPSPPLILGPEYIMIGHRTKLSLCQFLELQDAALCGVILAKAGITGDFHQQLLFRCLQVAVDSADQQALQIVLDELVRTSSDLRARVSPKYRFEVRWDDLFQCLKLDGYIVDGNQIRAADPSIRDAEPIDDDLLQGLAQCSAPRREAIIRKINESSAAFRETPPNYNACLNDARVALETLAGDIAASLDPPTGAYDASKWGSIIQYLRSRNVISLEEEKGLAGVYGFVSPGSHRPIGVSEEQMARLGRSFALNMCWFLLQRRNAYN